MPPPGWQRKGGQTPGHQHGRLPAAAALLAASIFLDALNVFLFFLRIFSRGD
jgi:hypothetical protein